MVERGVGEAAMKPRGEVPWRLVGKVCLAVAALVGLYFLGADITRAVAKQMATYKTDETLWTAALIYTTLLAIPGVPGVEIGLLMIVMFGGKGALVVYGCTILALNISFAMGRWMPSLPWVKRWISATTATTAATPEGVVGEGAAPPVGGETHLKVALQRSRIGRWVSAWMSTRAGFSRYVMVGLMLNMPGNFVLGGGGGIGMLCGLNRAFSWPGFVVVVAVAVSPLPLLVYFGVLQLDFIQDLIGE
jgi:hypothetical protein